MASSVGASARPSAVPSRKPGGGKFTKRLTQRFKASKAMRLLMAAILALGLVPVTALSQPDEAHAAGTTYFGEVLGISRQQLIDHLNNNASSYLGTTYKYDWPAPTVYETGPWWSNGNHPYESYPYNGSSGYGMNCSGFIGRVWEDMGLGGNSLVSSWYNAHIWKYANSETLRNTLINYGCTYYTYNSKADMLASGKLEKGDIVQMDSSSGVDDHVGIFWGDSPSDDKFWHSIFYHNSNTAGENMISEIYGKMTSGTYYLFKLDEQGYIDLDKDSSDTALTDGNTCYDLTGATYGIYSSWNDANNRRNAVTTLTCDRTGYAKSGKLNIGTYYVRETTPGTGYNLDETIYTVNVSSGQTSRVNGNKVYDVPNGDPANVLLKKFDGERTYGANNLPQGSASLALAQYTISYYGGYYNSEAEAEAATQAGVTKRQWVMQTDEDGWTSLRAGNSTFTTKDGTTHPYKVSGSDFYYSISGDIMLPLGTVVIKETKAPEGYNLSENPPTVQQLTLGGTVLVNEWNTPTLPEPVIRGGVEVNKIDHESLLGFPLGSATLKDAEFAIKNVSEQAVKVDGVEVAPGHDTPITLVTDENGVASTAADALPYGDYELRETKAPMGYLLSNEVWSFSVREEGVIVRPTTEQAIDNQVKRGDIEFTKKDATSSTRMAGVPFLITSDTTGEAHVVVTDANGFATTASSYNAHTASTNASDAAWDGTAINESKLNADAGIWFGLTREGWTTTADNSLGALPYDTYTIEELPCAANEGLQLVKQTGIVVSRDKLVIDLGTIDDPEAQISTTARDAVDGDKVAAADNELTIIDRISYSGLIPNREYKVEGTLMDKATGKPFAPAGKNLVTTATFTPDTTSGYVEVEFTFNADGMDELDLVCFEKLYDASGRVIATHEDIDDSDQTVKVVPPEVATTAVDGADSDKELSADPEAVIVDTVNYKNLVPGKTYTLNATLMVKNTETTVLDADGNPVTAATEFIADATDGAVDVTFTFDASALGGSDVVAFESLVRDGVEIAAHADITDENQTVKVVTPEIGTTARDAADSDKELSADPEAELRDTVEYHNLVPGKTYTLEGTLMNKATGEPVLDADGNPVTATTEFVPDLPHGYADVLFTFDASALGGSDVVVFETLLRNGIEITKHADIDDEGQTVKVVTPEIGTSLLDGEDGDKNVVADPEITLVDTVSYKNLVPGKPYTVTGTLMKKDTNEPLIDALGMEVVASTEFIPDHATGSVDVTFTFDGSLIAGNELVAFETLYRNGIEITAHADIDDIDQTVEVTPPEIGTTLVDNLDGDKNVVADPEITLVDTVSYKNLVPGKPYTVTGTLMKKDTNEPLIDALGMEVVASTEFIPDHATGSVDVTFTFDGSLIAGNELVAFETLYRNGIEITAHADIDDIDQTVEVTPPEIGTTLVDNLDGDKNVVADPDVTLVDTVEYHNLMPGKTYTVAGTLMVKATGEALVDAEGNFVTGSTEFVPDHPQGSVDVTFTFDVSLLAGNELVAFESLLRNDIEMTAHADLEDEGQTVEVTPSEISTLATDGFDGDKNIVADGTATIVDTVSYKNVLVGGNYSLSGILMDKATGLPLITGDADEEDVRALFEEICVACGFGHFEDDGHGNREYHAYGEVEDDTATEPADGEQIAESDNASESLGDTEATTPSDDEGTEGDTGEQTPEMPDADGILPINPDYEALAALLADNAELVNQMVLASADFKPEHVEGTVDVTFEFDASRWIQAEDMADTVVFELLAKDGVIIAAHADLEDKGQTTTIVASEIATTATDKSDGDKTLQRHQDATIVDTVSYKNLIPGLEYEVRGILMDKATGKKLMVNDKTIEATALFTPNSADGEIELEFRFDSTGLAGKEVVVFEYLYKEGVEVAVHADITDENQTVTIEKETPPGTVFDKTADMLAQYGWIVALLVFAAGGSAAYGLRQRKLAAAEGDTQAATDTTDE